MSAVNKKAEEILAEYEAAIVGVYRDKLTRNLDDYADRLWASGDDARAALFSALAADIKKGKFDG